MAWPLVVGAQQPEQMHRIGVLMAFPEDDPEAQSWIAGFREELGKLGWAEGHNIQINTRWATADVESLQRFTKQLAALQAGTSFLRAAHPPLRQCGSKRTPSPLFSPWWVILSAADSSRACRGQPAI